MNTKPRKYIKYISITLTDEDATYIRATATALGVNLTDIGRKLLLDWANDNNEEAKRIGQSKLKRQDAKPSGARKSQPQDEPQPSPTAIDDSAPAEPTTGTTAPPENAISVKYKTKNQRGHWYFTVEYVEPVQLSDERFSELETIIVQQANAITPTTVWDIQHYFRDNGIPFDVREVMTVITKSERLTYNEKCSSLKVKKDNH